MTFRGGKRPFPWRSGSNRQLGTTAPRAGHNGSSSTTASIRGAAAVHRGRGNSISRGHLNSSRGGHNNNIQPSKGLDLRQLIRLADDKAEPSEIIRFLGNAEGGLPSSLEEHQNDYNYVEHVLLALGNFCQKNGATQFREGFISVVQVLASPNHHIFSQVRTIIKNTLTSQTGDRLKRLINAVYNLATEMIVLIPAFACNCLGEDFFTDILTLKGTASIQKMNIAEAFDILQRGVELLQVTHCFRLLSQLELIIFIVVFDIRSHGNSTALLRMINNRPIISSSEWRLTTK